MDKTKHLARRRIVYLIIIATVLLSFIEWFFMFFSGQHFPEEALDPFPYAFGDGFVMAVASFCVCWFMMGKPMQKLIG